MPVTLVYLMAAALVFGAVPVAVAQEAAPQLAMQRERTRPSDSGSASTGRRAVPRQQAAEPEPAAAPEERPAPAARPARAPRERPTPRSRPAPTRIAPTRIEPAEPAGAGSPAAAQGRAVPRGSRPQGDNPRTGTAVPRGARPAPPVAGGGSGTWNRGRDRDRTIVVRPPVYNNYYYYPRRYYPYGYGAFGLGYFYYDPYRWYPGHYPTYGYRGYRSGFGFDVGELRLQVRPRDAQVFVDGYYAGVVDDFDGLFQGLNLEAGPYLIEIVAPGYEPLEFDVRILRGEKITYRGELRRFP